MAFLIRFDGHSGFYFFGIIFVELVFRLFHFSGHPLKFILFICVKRLRKDVHLGKICGV